MVRKKSAFNFDMMMSKIHRMMRNVLMLLGMTMLLVENERHLVQKEVLIGGGMIFVNAFSTASIGMKQSPTWERRRKNEEGEQHGPVVVVGKIIIDEYRSPLDDGDDEGSEIEGAAIEEETKITIGGGGPQAAWGAAAALAVMEQMETSSSKSEDIDNKAILENSENTRDHPFIGTVPPQQSVAFLGPVGNANGLVLAIQEGLKEILGPAVDTIELVVEPSLQTPTIQLWHDEQQDIQWKPLNDCWGSKGADSLWKNRPSAEDILQLDCLMPPDQIDEELSSEDESGASNADAIDADDDAHNKINISNLHLIMEMGVSAAGGGQDSEFLFDTELMNRVSHLCIEPIAFPQETTTLDGDENEAGSMAIPHPDVLSSQERLQPHCSKMNLIVPDSHLVEAWIKYGYLEERCQVSEVVGRFGPSGSRVYYPNDTHGKTEEVPPEKKKEDRVMDHPYIHVPTATLETADGKPVNPTGAGNAYSAALSTCRSRGWSLEEAACLASAVGATFCEYEHLPPWTFDVLDRIQRGTLEVYKDMMAINTSWGTREE